MFVPGACGCCGCTCEQAKFDPCPDDYTVTFDVLITHPDETTETGTATLGISKDVDFFGNDIWTGFEVEGGLSATIFCLDGVWILQCFACGVVGEDFWFAFHEVEVGTACECPATGTYTTEDNATVVLE